MARTGSGTLLSRRNIKLDSFLKRNLERTEYERIRTHEPCVVTSETVNKVYMHAVVSHERVYVTEYSPRTLTVAVTFRRVRDIELVNDLPDFLSGKNREHCQHIRITYVTTKPLEKGRDWLKRDKGAGFPFVAPPFRRNSHSPSKTHTFKGYPAESEERIEELQSFKSARSASCPNPETLGLLRMPHPPPNSPTSLLPPTGPSSQVPRRSGLVPSRLLRRDCEDGDENELEREAELHLYAVSQTSRLYLQLQSAWNRFIIRSTLLLDPLYRRKCGSYPGKWRPTLSWAWTCHLFDQLTSELLQDHNSVESLYLLLQELKTAAHGNVSLVSLFWRSGELCVFLVQTLEKSLHSENISGVNTEDQILLNTLIVETLAVMFTETQGEAARLDTLSANNGALASRMLLAVICDPLQVISSELQVLLSEYLDATCWLLFELLLLGLEVCSGTDRNTSRHFSADNFLSIGWILRVLKPHPHLFSFVTYQAQQVVLVLSDLQGAVLSPTQCVLLFQRCRLLLACLLHNSPLTEHVRSQLREEFRYYMKPSYVEEKLSRHYPIMSLTLRLVDNFLTLMLHK